MQFAILVSAILVILLASFLALTSTHKFFKTQSKFLLNSVNYANKGINFTLNPKNEFNDSLTIENENIKTKIKKSYWGGFERVESQATINSKKSTKIALIGNKINIPPIALYVANKNLSLFVAGDTRIEGDAYLFGKTIRPGIIGGERFEGPKLVDGAINRNSGSLPPLNLNWVKHLKSLQHYFPESDESFILNGKINKNSFFDKTLCYYDTGKLILSETYIGNIIIRSETEIIISSQAKLVDVTVVAPKITIESGFSGSASLIAQENILLEKDVEFLYPSALVIFREKNKESDNEIKEAIYISDKVLFNGVITFISNEEKKIEDNVDLLIQPEATINGEIYCQGNIELKGTVIGSIYTNKFLVKKGGTVYQNYIYNGKILAKDIHQSFCGLPLINTKKGVVKWLY